MYRSLIPRLRLVMAALAALTMDGCIEVEPGPERVLLVTTTTLEASGLLDTLVAEYHRSQDLYRVSATAVGSGAALELGRRRDADLLLTHDSVAEAQFMEEGRGLEQGPVMENEFVLVGPAEDPAGIRGMTDLAAALERIAAAEAVFISRADESGTHRTERLLWQETGRSPGDARADWHVQAGSGMAETLRIASQRGGYLLSDIATFRRLESTLGLECLARGDPPVPNRYRYTLPTDPRNPAAARHLLEWLLGPAQQVIGGYGVERFGEALFRPTAVPRPPGPPEAAPPG